MEAADSFSLLFTDCWNQGKKRKKILPFTLLCFALWFANCRALSVPWGETGLQHSPFWGESLLPSLLGCSTSLGLMQLCSQPALIWFSTSDFVQFRSLCC